MAQLYNTQTQRYEPVPDNEVAQRVQTGQFLFAGNAMVPIRLPDGTKHEIEAQYAAQAFDLGGQYITAAEQKEDRLRKDYGSGWGNAISAFTLGALSGATITGSNYALVESGIITKEALDAYKKYQTGSYYSGEVGGTVGSIAATMGLGALAQGGVRGAATVARAANVVMPAAGVARGAAAAGRGVTNAMLARAGANVTAGQAKAARAVGLLTEGTIDAGAFAGAEMLTEAAMGNPNVNAESIVSNVGLSMVVGGALNALIPGLGTAFTYSKDKTGDLFLASYRRMFGSDIQNPDLAMRQVAETIVKTEGITIEEALKRIDISSDGNKFRRNADEAIVEYNDKLLQIDESLTEVIARREELRLAKRDDELALNRLVIEYQDNILQRAKAIENIDAKRAADLRDEHAELAAADIDVSFKKISEQLRQEELLARDTKKHLTDEIKGLEKEVKRQGKEHLKTASHHYEDTIATTTHSMQALDNVGDDIARAMMGENRTKSLVDKITNGTADGEYVTDLVDSLMESIAKRQGELKTKVAHDVTGTAGDIADAQKILGQLEKDINAAFEETLGYKYVRKVDPEVAATKAAAGEVVDTDAFLAAAKSTQDKSIREANKQNVIATAKLTGDLDMELKKVLFPIIDKARKELGDITFAQTRDGAVGFGTQKVLRQVWDDITRAQKHKAFGEAGTTLGRMNDNWTAFIEARGNLARRFRGTVVKNKKKQIDSSKIRSFFRTIGSKQVSKSHETIEIINAYSNAVSAIGKHGNELGLVDEMLLSNLSSARRNQRDGTQAAFEYHQTQQLLQDMMGGDPRMSPEMFDSGLYDDIFHSARSASEARDMLDAHVKRTSDELGPLRQEKEAIYQEKQGEAIAAAERKADGLRTELDDVEFRKTFQNEKEHYQNLLDEARRTAGADKQVIEEQIQASAKRIDALKREAAYAHKNERPPIYRPDVEGQQPSILAELNTQGTTSPIGLLGFMVNGWMGSAAATMGASSLIKRIQNVANGQQRYIAKMDLHDELMRYEKHRREMLKDAVMGKLERTMKRKRPSTLSVLIANTAHMGDFGDIKDPKNASDFQKSASRLRQIESNPEAKAALIEEAVQPLAQVAPEHAEATKLKVSRSLSLAASKLPADPPQEMLRNRRREYQHPDSEIYRFQRDYDVIDDYVETLREGFATKALMAHQVDTFKENDPHSYQICVEECLSIINEMDDPMDADTEAVMAVFIGSEISPFRTPAFMNTIQPSFAAPEAAQPNPQGAALKKLPQSHMTPSQMRYS